MGAWTEIVDYTVPSNTTSVVLNDFGTITKDDFIKVVTTFIANGTVSNDNIFIYANTATTASNYHTQSLFADDTTISPFRTNSPLIQQFVTGGADVAVNYIKLSENDRFNAFSNGTKRLDSSTRIQFNYVTSSGATFASGITSLTFQAQTTNGIGTGSRIQIYRLDAEKVADITVTSNTTQVDISSLSIGKDSEYLLVTDLLDASNNFPSYRLAVNDNTTFTNYYSQRIRANDTTLDAERRNDPRFATTPDLTRTLVYSHIKLSEIGAYTSQNYGIQSVGTSNIVLQNFFVSSIAENITSITKLNVISNRISGIGSGSRFILYKLK
jgi:hypothetical protein